MAYEFPFTIEKNTTKGDPREEHVKVEWGVITYIEIEFPDGCKGYVGVRIFHGSYQITPKNPDEWHVSDDYVIPIKLEYRLFSEPYVLRLVGYNEDDSYEHTPRVRITILRAALTPALAIGEIEAREREHLVAMRGLI